MSTHVISDIIATGRIVRPQAYVSEIDLVHSLEADQAGLKSRQQRVHHSLLPLEVSGAERLFFAAGQLCSNGITKTGFHIAQESNLTSGPLALRTRQTQWVSRRSASSPRPQSSEFGGRSLPWRLPYRSTELSRRTCPTSQRHQGVGGRREVITHSG